MKNKEIKQFIEEFIKKHRKLISRVASKYRIPNRYENDDMLQHIAQKIQEVLKSREGKENKILDPEKYFKSCLDFYCIEYQRMNGFIFNLPSRPRKNCEDHEKEAKSKGFKYLGDITIEEENTLYIEENFIPEEELDQEYNSESWSFLTGMVTKDQMDVIYCREILNLKFKEIAEYLDVKQATCWFRHKRGMDLIRKNIESMSGQIKDNIKNILRNNG